MATRAEQITAAVFALLSAAPVLVNGNVWRSRVRGIPLEVSLAIVLVKKSDVRLGASTLNRSQRQLTLTAEIYARGDLPDVLADGVVEQVASRMLADRNLGGLCDDILASDAVPDWAGRDSDLVVMDLDFMIDYEIENTIL